MMETPNASSTRSNAVMSNYTTDKEKCYAHLSTEEREEIVAGLEQGESRRTIAKKLGGNPPRSAGKSGETPRF
jgi:transposase-like protein